MADHQNILGLKTQPVLGLALTQSWIFRPIPSFDHSLLGLFDHVYKSRVAALHEECWDHKILPNQISKLRVGVKLTKCTYLLPFLTEICCHVTFHLTSHCNSNIWNIDWKFSKFATVFNIKGSHPNCWSTLHVHARYIRNSGLNLQMKDADRLTYSTNKPSYAVVT